MAEKHTTLGQLRINALRTKSEVLALLVDAFEGVQVGMTITLPAASWVSGAQTIQDSGFVADDGFWYFVMPNENNVQGDNVTTNGEMTFHCSTTPQSDITIYILRLEVET